MKSISTLPEFASLSELEIQSALDAYDAMPGQDNDDAAPENPIVREFFRLVNAYTERFDEILSASKKENDDPQAFLEDIFNYEPPNAIEREAFDFFYSVYEDALRDMDDGTED